MDLFVISTLITSLGGGAVVIQLLRMIDRERDRRMLREVLQEHGEPGVEAISTGISQTRWRPALPQDPGEDDADGPPGAR